MEEQFKTQYTTQEIYQILEKEIIDLILPPGLCISEIETSKKFSVSRTPIRDVFKKLENNNLVEIIPQKGTIITPINLKRISDFMFIREKIELGAIEDILLDSSNSQLVPLQLILIKQRKLLESANEDIIEISNNFFQLDNEFHLMLFELSNKTHIWEYLIALMPDYQRFRAISAEFDTLDSMQFIYDQHQQILLGLEAHDFEGIRSIYKKHIYKGLQNLSQLVEMKEKFFVI